MELIKKLDMRVEENAKIKERKRWGLFFCSICNTEVERRYYAGLKQKTCGCIRPIDILIKKSTKHGYATRENTSRLYTVWMNMKSRCNFKNHKSYNRYGGRGIKVCKDWEKDFIIFKDWALSNRYNDKLHIDRIKNNKGYSPENCQFIRQIKNNRKRPSNKLNFKKADEIRLFFKADIGLTKKMLAKLFKVNISTIRRVLRFDTWYHNERYVS